MKHCFKKFLFLTILSIHLHVSCKYKPEVPAHEIYGTVVRITDGDTFTLLTAEKKQIKIRLHGIDCPERRQEFGQVAKQKLSDLIFQKNVQVKQTAIDRYSRTVAIVYTDQMKCVNEEMLKAGLAWHFVKYDSNTLWQHMEDSARKYKIGLWDQPTPTPPWQWRRN